MIFIMALTYRIYRAARTGDGLSVRTAFRSALSDFIVEDGSGATFHDELTSGTVRYALARCDSTVHAAVAIDPRVQVVSPELALKADLSLMMDADASTTFTFAFQNRLIADGHPIVGTVRQTLAFLWAAMPLSFFLP